MSTAYETAWGRTNKHEGAYANNAADPGGETMHGITARVARAHGFAGEMRDLPITLARQIGKSAYWDIWRGDDVAVESVRIACEIFDTLFNGGDSPRWLQLGLNLFNRQARDYPDLKVDGRVGMLTITALRKFMIVRGSDGERALLKYLNCIQGARFAEITERNEALETFFFGWFVNRIEI